MGLLKQRFHFCLCFLPKYIACVECLSFPIKGCLQSIVNQEISMELMAEICVAVLCVSIQTKWEPTGYL